MKEVIYIDVLILENFFMNYLLLYFINRFCKCRIKKWRIIIAAFIGALYVFVVFYPDLHMFYSVIMKFMISVLMIIVAFSPYKLKRFIKILILFYIEAFIIGGFLIGILYLGNSTPEIINGALIISNISPSPEYIIIGSIIAIILVKFGFDYFEGYYVNEKTNVQLEIILNNKKCTLTALIDTGNSLKDPITNMPVIIVYYKTIVDILPDELKEIVLKDCSYEIFKNRIMDSELKSRIRIIPYKALGVENGILIGIRMDLVISRLKSKTNVVKEPIIALYNKPISNAGDYQALTYPGIIKGEY